MLCTPSNSIFFHLIPASGVVPIASSHCGYSRCTDAVWDAPVGDGTHSCGGRIHSLQRVYGYDERDCGYDESGACRQVTEEYPDICTCAKKIDPVKDPGLTKAPDLTIHLHWRMMDATPRHGGFNELFQKLWWVARSFVPMHIAIQQQDKGLPTVEFNK